MAGERPVVDPGAPVSRQQMVHAGRMGDLSAGRRGEIVAIFDKRRWVNDSAGALADKQVEITPEGDHVVPNHGVRNIAVENSAVSFRGARLPVRVPDDVIQSGEILD